MSIFLSCQCSFIKKNANDNLVNVCMMDNNKLKVLYLDSTKGITKMNTVIQNDTIVLTIYVSTVKEQKDHIILIEDHVKYVCYENKTLNIEDIPECSKIMSGKEALQYIEDLNNEYAPKSPF